MTPSAVSPEDALLGLHERLPDRYPALLESMGGSGSLGRYDVLFALPGERLVLGPDGTLDLNILIRTLVVAGDAVEFRTGAGIVADSLPAAELAETRAKARGLLAALGSVA